ncbi:MAG: AmmeMemoRadiSam system protein B [Epsilonproteobacteria bacterium]|nr:AmmeMemoRadiSam system protein B [Campylobacterota bacterium]
MSSRVMSVAGTFYPNSCQEIKKYITKFDAMQKTEVKPKFEPKAIISPHAGYVYSGFTANCAYKLIDKSKFKRVVVVGPSHRIYMKGASIALYDKYDTPCGAVPIDIEYSKKLMQKYDVLGFANDMHKEHSTETQIPFIKHYFPETKIVEIVYGDIDYKELALVVKEVLDEPETLLVISTDLSHFHTLKEANKVDGLCIEGIKKLDMRLLNSGCEACGLLGVKALISVAKESQVIDYRTSYDASGDDKRVVGYLSVLVR